MSKWKRESLGGGFTGWVLAKPGHEEAIVRREGNAWLAGVGDDAQNFPTLAAAKRWCELTQLSLEHTL
jgi:hypothetical protein